MPNRKYIIGLTLLVICLAATMAMAGNVKERMIKRAPIINGLLAEGVVGENNQGFLEFKGAQKQADVISAENADRAMVYRAIAKKTGTTPDLVGQRRAAMIAQSAPAGTWLQDVSGKWYQK